MMSKFKVRDFLAVFVLYWKWFVLSIFCALIAGVAYLYFVKPSYSVSGKMQIRENKKESGISASLAAISSSIPFGLGNSLGGSVSTDAEIEVIKSSLLVRDVVNNLGLHTEYRLCKWGRKQLLYNTNPLIVSADSAVLQVMEDRLPKDVYSISLTIDKKSDNYSIEGVVRRNSERTDLEKTEVRQLPATISTPIGNLVLQENKMLPAEVRSSMNYSDDYTIKVKILPPIEVANLYLKHLIVSPPTKKATSMLKLILKDEDSQRGIDFINQMIDVYNSRYNEAKNEELRKTDEFVNNRLASLDLELGSTDADWEKLKTKFKVTDPRLDAQESMTMKSTYETKLVDISAQLQIIEYLYEYVNNPSNRYSVIPSSIGLTDQSASMELINNYNSNVIERNRLLRSMSEHSPQVQLVTKAIDDLYPSVKTSLLQAKQAVALQRRTLEREYDKYLGRMDNTPHVERELTDISRQREIKQGVYLLMLQKREETAMELANTVDKGILIDKTQYIKNSKQPRTKLVLIAAFLFGVAIPLCIIYIMLMLRKQISTTDDIKKLSSCPITGIIPETRENSEDIFRALRSNLLEQVDENNNVIVVTSKESSAGKTYIAARLAKSLALLGKKVVCCDLNPDNPTLAKDLNVPVANGIVNLLKTSDLSLSDVSSCVSHVSETGIDVLGSDSKCAMNSSDILSRGNLKTLVSMLRSEYDYVILDAPAFDTNYSAQYVAGMADVTCFVCRIDQTTKESVVMTDNLAKIGKLNRVNYILNSVNMKTSKNRYYFKGLLSVLFLGLITASCGSSQKIAYLENSDSVTFDRSVKLYDARIMPKDVLTITVSTITPDAATPFNLTVPSLMANTNSLTAQPTLQTYLVSNDGTIDFPIIGSIKVGGLTKEEAEKMITDKITPYMAESENPIVTVRMSSYSISVLGEVKNPGSFMVSREKITIFEALAQAGDMTIYGLRDKVKLIREDAEGHKFIYTLNLNDANIINSPYYYLQQNDIVMVEPSKIKKQDARVGSMTTLYFSATSILMSLATLIINVVK